jgi:hypothetical protein
MSEETPIFGVPENIVSLLREVYYLQTGSYPSYDTQPINEDMIFLLNDLEDELSLDHTPVSAFSKPEATRASFEAIYHAITGGTYITNSPVPENLERILQDTIVYMTSEGFGLDVKLVPET